MVSPPFLAVTISGIYCIFIILDFLFVVSLGFGILGILKY